MSRAVAALGEHGQRCGRRPIRVWHCERDLGIVDLDPYAVHIHDAVGVIEFLDETLGEVCGILRKVNKASDVLAVDDVALNAALISSREPHRIRHRQTRLNDRVGLMRVRIQFKGFFPGQQRVGEDHHRALRNADDVVVYFNPTARDLALRRQRGVGWRRARIVILVAQSRSCVQGGILDEAGNLKTGWIIVFPHRYSRCRRRNRSRYRPWNWIQALGRCLRAQSYDQQQQYNSRYLESFA